MCLDSEGLSPSQMMADWSPRVCSWRTKHFHGTLRTPSANHAHSESGLQNRLHCYNDYASGRPAPTSGKSTTFGGGSPCPRSRHHDRVVGRSKSRMGDLPVRLTVTRNRNLRRMG